MTESLISTMISLFVRSPQLCTNTKNKRTAETHTPSPPIKDLSGQEEVMIFLASNSSFVCGRGGEIECGVISFRHLLK